MLWYFTHVQLGIDRREGKALMVSCFKALMELISYVQNPGLKNVRNGPFKKNVYVSVLSNASINIKGISGCYNNSKTWISMWNFAAKLIALLVIFSCLVVGVPGEAAGNGC